ncbi:MAG: helix-hairpin-helix domain-containing protein [Bacteroidales bacterium]|nr:helix-hairpin-helix domain-containing protein [Bacteroidales bacterium]
MKREKLSKAAASGAVALIFLILGFQAAIFTGNVFRYNREHRVDTVFVVGDGQRSLDSARDDASVISTGAKRSGEIQKGIAPQKELDYGDSRRIIAQKLEKKPEPQTFPFDPNTVSHEDLVRLGFSERQAQVIENYRSKGGKYRSARDFAKMYVVDSATFARLEPYISITKMDLNTADSAALLTLRGIGPYYAHKILEYRRRLGGIFTTKEQLLEIEGFDEERLAGFAEGIEVGKGRPYFTLWDADRAQLASHPYIGTYAAKGILRYKSVADTAAWSLDNLVKNGVIKGQDAPRLRYLDVR